MTQFDVSSKASIPLSKSDSILSKCFNGYLAEFIEPVATVSIEFEIRIGNEYTYKNKDEEVPRPEQSKRQSLTILMIFYHSVIYFFIITSFN